MSYDPSYKLPATVSAVEVANSLVSDRYLQLSPAYTGGKALANGGTVKKAAPARPSSTTSTPR